MPATGRSSGRPPIEPKKAALPKVKIPPSAAAATSPWFELGGSTSCSTSGWNCADPPAIEVTAEPTVQQPSARTQVMPVTTASAVTSGVGWADHAVPFQASTSGVGWRLPPPAPRGPTIPDAQHWRGPRQVTPVRIPGTPGVCGAATTDQLVPSHRSARFPLGPPLLSVVEPAAQQSSGATQVTADSHDPSGGV